jgi:large subunit ribosomal protein L25
MAQDTKTKTLLNVAPRSVLGKKVRALRREGFIPANIYGHRVDSVAVQVVTDDFKHLLKERGRRELVYIQVDGEERPTFIRDIQRNPVTDQILHVDFLQISLTETVRLEVPIHLTGKSPAVADLGGILTHQLSQVTVEALPMSIPSLIEVDVSGLEEINSTIHVSDLAPIDGVTFVTDAESVIARVDAPAIVVEEAPAAAEGEEGAPAAAEGEAAAGGEEKKEGGDES